MSAHDGSASAHLLALQVDAINLEESGFNAACELRARGVEFDAIVAASDLIAIGALRALQEAGVDVPRQVAVVGFDDIPAASLTNPPLTTVMQDTRRAGELLVETLLRQIAGESAINSVIPTRLVIRKSAEWARPPFAISRAAPARPASTKLTPPTNSTLIGCPPSNGFSESLRTLAATSCGITMKKLKMPMYTPILRDGRCRRAAHTAATRSTPSETDADHRRQQPAGSR
jgi:hypothetical protein